MAFQKTLDLYHADVTITLRVYAHLLPNAQDAAAEAMGRLFGTTAT